MSVSLYELFDGYIQSVQTDPIFTLTCSFFTSYMAFYVLGISYYATNHFLIEWKERQWANATVEQVIEEVKYIIRKHNECADLDTVESVITESINLTKYSHPYRMECYRQGIKDRVKMLENV